MIQAQNLFKSFANTTVLKDISATFDKGKTNLSLGKVVREKLYF